jgi:hypothetical protein
VQLLLNRLRAYTEQQQQQEIHLVSAAWLEAVLSTGRHVPEASYSLNHLLQQQQQHSAWMTTAAAAAPAVPLADAGGGGGAGAGGGVALLRPLPGLSNLPDAPLGR